MALYPQDGCLHDFPLPPGMFSLRSENRIYRPTHVSKDDKQLASVCPLRWSSWIFRSQSSPCLSQEPKQQTSPKGTAMYGTEHAIPPAGSIRRGVGMPCTDPRSLIPILLLISDSPLRHSFTEIGGNACGWRSCTPEVKIIIWLSKTSLTAGLV